MPFYIRPQSHNHGLSALETTNTLFFVPFPPFAFIQLVPFNLRFPRSSSMFLRCCSRAKSAPLPAKGKTIVSLSFSLPPLSLSRSLGFRMSLAQLCTWFSLASLNISLPLCTVPPLSPSSLGQCSKRNSSSSSSLCAAWLHFLRRFLSGWLLSFSLLLLVAISPEHIPMCNEKAYFSRLSFIRFSLSPLCQFWRVYGYIVHRKTKKVSSLSFSLSHRPVAFCNREGGSEKAGRPRQAREGRRSCAFRPQISIPAVI